MVNDQILQEMKTYYRQRAREYNEWFYRVGRYDRGPENNAAWFAETDEVFAALEAFHLDGEVLELASGTGIWTERLVRTAASVTAVDASLEVMEINRTRVASERVSYVQADLFNWQPERLYDAVFFGFWLSHVPLERLDSFLQLVTDALRPGGKVFFVDSRRESSGTAGDQLLPEPDSQVVTRILNDGRTFEIVKNFYSPSELVARAEKAGLELHGYETANYFLYGSGLRR